MVTLKEIEKDFAPFVNKYGFVSPDTDHMPLFHGFYLLVLDRNNLLTPDQIKKHKAIMETLIHPEYPGILMPRPQVGRNGNNYSHDTHTAMFWISQRLNMDFSRSFLKHGRDFGYWNPINPKEWNHRGLYQRFLPMMATAQISAGGKPCFINKMGLYAKLNFQQVKNKRAERVTLGVFMCKVLDGYSKTGDNLCSKWRKRVLEAYPGGLGERLHKWGGVWKDSPYAKHLEGYI